MRKVRAAILTLTALMVLAAGLVPACGELCCKRAGTPTVHAQMPCCEPSLAQRDTRPQPATAAHIEPVVVEQAVVTIAAAPVEQHYAAESLAPHTTPPLFLLNEQFRI